MLSKKDIINHFFLVDQYKKFDIDRSEKTGIKQPNQLINFNHDYNNWELYFHLQGLPISK